MAFTLCSYSHAQQVSLFQNLSIKDGLPSNYVFGATEDSDGYLWIGTDKGLAKYDGFRWTQFTTDNGLPGNYIAEIYKAGKNGLWLLISNKGVYYFNTATNQLQFVTEKVLDHLMQTNSEGSLFFYKTRHDEKSQYLDGLWVSPIDPKKINIAFQKTEYNWGKYIITDFPNKIIYIDAAHLQNISSSRALHLAKGWTIEAITINLVQERDILMPVAKTIVASDKNIFTMNNGQAKKIAQVSFVESANLNITRYQNQTVTCNEKEGIYFVNDNGSVKHYTENDGLSNNLVSRGYVLRNGKIIFCTLGGGLSYKLPYGNATINTFGHEVSGLTQDDNYIYAAIPNKIIRYNKSNFTYEEFVLPDKNIQSVDVWGNKIYVSTMTGFSVYDIVNNRLIKENEIKKYAGISNVVQSGGRYFAGSYGNNILEYKNKNLKEDTSTLWVSERVQPIRNGLAAYNYEDGLQLINFNGDRKMLTEQNGLPSRAVYHVHEYKDTLWISTKRGIAAYAQGKIIKTITAQQGITGNRCIFSFHDSIGNLWILTDKYLGRFDGNRVVTYVEANIREGINDYIHCALYDTLKHTIYTGTLKNLFVNNLEDVDLQSISLPPTLQQIILNGKVSADSILNIPQQYHQLTFTFSPFNINPFTKATLLYKLEGRDNQFAELKDSLSVSFNKLSSGKYTLLAKIINEDGVESETKTLCTFYINKPFWQTAWFVFLALIISSIVTYFFTRRYQKIKQKQKEKERIMEQQLITERERISRELHDNLGTNIVTIIAQSDNIEAKLRNGQSEEALQKVCDLGDQSRETMNVLRETIWAVQESTHSFTDFTTRVKTFLQRTYAVTNIEWESVVKGFLNQDLTPEQTLHLFRCVQECTQNIIKHSGATQAYYEFIGNVNELHILIRDNGKGFNSKENDHGNGLKNLQSRIEELKGKISIQSTKGKGTIINIESIV